jgi:hypothetical protein
MTVKDITVKQKWWGWHNANPHVYVMFERYALRVIGTGKTQFSAWAIIQRMRWEVVIETKGDDFKISNDFIAYYSRLFHAYNPEHDGFFRTKKLKDEA